MYRNTTVGSLPLVLSSRLFAKCSFSLIACVLAFCGLALFGGLSLEAQSNNGGVQGTVTDKSGAVIAKASVTATNTDTGVAETRETNSTGNYSISPLQPGDYNLEFTAKGFERLLQENVTVDATSIQRVDEKLSVGGENTTVTITDAPPFLDTTDATVGGTIENELYSQLPLSMNGGPRDPTAFQYLMPGVQENPANSTGQGANNGNSGIYGGTGQTNLNENYIDGVPVTAANQGGNSIPISSAVSVDAVDQFSVQTNGASTAFGGAGSSNYTIKSGGNQFHGTVFEFIRNTMFDTWGYFAKAPLVTGLAEKPGEHQDSYGGSLGGPILKDKLFFFGSYEGFHYTKISNTPTIESLPTLAERTGNFTDAYGVQSSSLADPTASTSKPPFQGIVNGIPTFNVIPQSELSTISLYLQRALPAPNGLATFNNYLAGLPLANQDYSVDVRMDYTLNARNKFSIVGVAGNVGYGGEPFYSTQAQLPAPYAAGIFTNQKSASGVITYTYIVSQTMINSLKYGYTRTWGNGFSLTSGKSSALMPNNAACGGGENSCAAGITNLPSGGATTDMPAISFSGGTAYQSWSSTPSTGPEATNSYTVIDNLQWIKGRHNITFGAQVQFLESNGANFAGYSKPISLQANSTSTGNSYASFLVGTYTSYSVSAQTITDVGARYRPMAPYIQDNWRATPKLTLNLGFRYDYLQPYHEVKDRIAYLNTTTINPLVGIPGVLEYAGFPNSSTPSTYAPYICHCTTPVHPYNKNFEPRLGFAYAANQSTVINGGFSIQLTHAGGSGGGSNTVGGANAGGAGASTQGSGNNGEFGATTSQSFTSSGEATGFFLNPGIQGSPSNAVIDPPLQGSEPTTFTGSLISPCTQGQTCALVPCVANNTCSPFSSLPPWTQPGLLVNPLQPTGNYTYATGNPDGCLEGTPTTTCVASQLNYEDPYYGGRGPQFVNYNFGIQRMINKKAVFTVNYAGSQTHFLPGGSGRGIAKNSFSPDYDLLLTQRLAVGAQASLSGVQSIIPSYNLPYPGFDGANATVASSLARFPQFATGGNGGGLVDLWGDTGNASFNSLQLSAIQRPWHNLSGFINYTRAKEIDDTGNHRTQYPMGPQDGNFTRHYTANQIDRGEGANSQTNAFNLTWVYQFPIGRGQAFFATNRIMGLIGGGWQLSGIYKYRDGYPLQITNGGACNTNASGGQGTCMPDYVPGFNSSSARINGRWGRGPGASSSATNEGQIQYLNPNAFACPDSPASNTQFTCGSANNTNPEFTWKNGNIARSAPLDLHGPGWWDIDLGIRRTFNVRETATLHLTFQVEADVSNFTNSTFFNLNGSATSWTNSAYGTIGGQNQSVQPRDWQFAGRFRF